LLLTAQYLRAIKVTLSRPLNRRYIVVRIFLTQIGCETWPHGFGPRQFDRKFECTLCDTAVIYAAALQIYGMDIP
jgi:hypothetical protein